MHRPPLHIYVMGLALVILAGQAAGPVAGGIFGAFVGATWAYWDWGFTWPLPPRGFGFTLERALPGPTLIVDRYGPIYSFGPAVGDPVLAFEPCRVYWGSHGCALPRGHADGAKNVGAPPYYGPETRFYGEDA